MKTAIAFAGLLALTAGTVAAQDRTTKDPPALPTDVRATIFAVDLIQIDGSEKAFRADIAFRLDWQDPRLANPGAGIREVPLSEIWHPRATIVNVRSGSPRFPEVATVDDQGLVTYQQRLIGEFSCPLDLRSFPFDEQTVFVSLISIGHAAEQVRYILDEERSGLGQHLSITDWSVKSWHLTPREYRPPGWVRTLPGVAIEIEVKRLARYYGGTIFATVAIILAMAWSVFWLPLATVPPRVSVSVTSMLSLIAYRFVAAQDLPRLPYLTRMDFFLLGAALLVLLGLAGVVAVAYFSSSERMGTAQRLNRLFRWGFPIVSSVLLVALII